MKLDDIANVFGAKVIEKIYDDALAPATKEGGKALSDFIKTLRLFTAPVQMLATWQDRLVDYLNMVRTKVPEDRQQESPVQIAGPIIDRLKYLEPGNTLTELFLNLLTCSIDSQRVKEAHPAFIYIINQLSADEAIILYELKSRGFDIVEDHNYDQEKKLYVSKTIIEPGLSLDKLVFRDNLYMYYGHLESLELVTWRTDKSQEPIMANNIQVGSRVFSKISTTRFGKLFLEACTKEIFYTKT